MKKVAKYGLTGLQLLFVEKLFECKTPTEAVIQTYGVKSRHNAANMAYELMHNPRILEYIDGLQIPNGELVIKLKECLTATKTHRQPNGKSIIEPDWSTILRALEIIFRVKGHLEYAANPVRTEPITVTFVRK